MSYDLKIINGDFVIKNGTLGIVTGKDKLIQDILKICLTEQGSNLYAPWYGSALSKSIIGSPLDPEITIDIAKSQIQNSLENLKKMQELQMLDINQKVQPDELIAAISSISVTRNVFDPRVIEVVVKVLNKAFDTLEASFSISNF